MMLVEIPRLTHDTDKVSPRSRRVNASEVKL